MSKIRINSELLKVPVKEAITDEIINKVVENNELTNKDKLLIELTVKATLEILKSANLIEIEN